MDIVRVFNGLGNQMSQYAFYLAKKERHPFMTFWTYFPEKDTSTQQHNGYELDKVFGIKRNRLTDQILKWLYYSDFMKGTIEGIWENQNYDFDEQMLDSRAPRHLRYFFGGWHSEKYFKDIKCEILKTYRFKDENLNYDSQIWLTQIRKQEESCSIHVRRGDYLQNEAWRGVANLTYYRHAICLMKEKFHNVHFYVFSNDTKWFKEHFGENDYTIVDCNTGEDSWQDMFLMSQCHHHINANSTFSWWAAWLCPFEDSLVITPSRFMSNTITKDVYPENWIRID